MPSQPPLPRERDCRLFLDIDGTLLDFAEWRFPTPLAVRRRLESFLPREQPG
jgi:hypothetical protein